MAWYRRLFGKEATPPVQDAAPTPSPFTKIEPFPPWQPAWLREDGWSNSQTGLGTARDKLMGAEFCVVQPLPWPELTALFYGDAIGEKIVATKPRQMFREGYEITGEDAALTEDIEECAEALRVNDILLESFIFSRLFGGGICLLGANDGGLPDTPLREELVRSFDFLNFIDRRYVTVFRYYSDPLAPNFYQPELYQVTNPLAGTSALIHESRVIRFDGTSPVDPMTRRQLAGWSYSVLQRPYDTIRQYATAYQAAAHLMQDASQGAMKIKGLIDMIAANEKGALQTRMAMVDQSRSVARMILLDADYENFERAATSFAGMPDLLEKFMSKVACDADLPQTILFGRSPAGQNATGDADFRAYYDTIKTAQKGELSPVLLRVLRLIARALRPGYDGKDLGIKYRPLWQATEAEQATTEKTVADRDVAYINAGVLTPEEVALARFDEDGNFSMTTKLSEVGREMREKAADDTATFETPEPPPTGAVNPADAGTPQGPNAPTGTSSGALEVGPQEAP